MITKKMGDDFMNMSKCLKISYWSGQGIYFARCRRQLPGLQFRS